MNTQTNRMLADLVLAALTLVCAALLFIGALSLPPPRFEPLGSAALPRILGTLLIVFSMIIAVTAIRMRHDTPSTSDSTGAKADPKRGALVLAALVTYVFAIDVLQIPFLVATPIFVTATGLAIGARIWRNLISFAVLGLILALFISTVLERLLYVRIG